MVYTKLLTHGIVATTIPRQKNLLKMAEIIEGIPFAPLTEVLKWKKAFGRPKDVVDIELIEQYLESHKHPASHL